MKHLGILLLLLLIIGIGFTEHLVKPQEFLGFDTPIQKSLIILLVILASSIISNFGVWLIQKYAKNKNKAELKQLTSVYKYAIVIILVFVIIVLLYGVIGSAITSIGLLAAGLTLALQRPILNLGGWFSIVAKRPFKIGDRVEIGAVGGYVHEISLMHTHLSLVSDEEHTGKMAYVPNEQLLTQPIVNYTKGSALIWDQVTVRVPPDADVKSVEKKLAECVNGVVGNEMKEASKKWKVEVKPEPRVALEYNSASRPHLEISMRYLANARMLRAIKTEITEKVIARFRKELASSGK